MVPTAPSSTPSITALRQGEQAVAFAGVADGDVGHGAVRQRGPEPSQPGGEVEQRAEALEPSATDQRGVHRPREIALEQGRADRLRDLDRHIELGLLGRGAEVRREDRGGNRPEG
jgi:hypothetical protein